MIDYKQKYLKYKMKYLTAKRNLQRGGAEAEVQLIKINIKLEFLLMPLDEIQIEVNQLDNIYTSIQAKIKEIDTSIQEQNKEDIHINDYTVVEVWYANELVKRETEATWKNYNIETDAEVKVKLGVSPKIIQKWFVKDAEKMQNIPGADENFEWTLIMIRETALALRRDDISEQDYFEVYKSKRMQDARNLANHFLENHKEPLTLQEHKNFIRYRTDKVIDLDLYSKVMAEDDKRKNNK